MTSKAIQTQRANYHYMADAMRMLEWDLHQTVLRDMRIPDDWHRIAREKPCRAKTRVTLRLDEDLVKFFRSMGPDWQVRVNRLMSVWMHARLAGLIEGAETMDYMKRRDDDEREALDGRRPHWGDPMPLSTEALLESAFDRVRAAQMMSEEDAVPMMVERKPSSVIKAEYMALKARKAAEGKG